MRTSFGTRPLTDGRFWPRAATDDKAVIGTYKLVARKRSLQSLPTFPLAASVSTRRRALPAAKVKPNAP